jgi:hypothetical protein
MKNRAIKLEKLRKGYTLLSGDGLTSMCPPPNPDVSTKRQLNYDEWFLQKVNEGIAAADRGELMDHTDGRKMIDERYSG